MSVESARSIVTKAPALILVGGGILTVAASLAVLAALSPLPFFTVSGIQPTARNICALLLTALAGVFLISAGVSAWKGQWRRTLIVGLAGLVELLCATVLIAPS